MKQGTLATFFQPLKSRKPIETATPEMPPEETRKPEEEKKVEKKPAQKKKARRSRKDEDDEEEEAEPNKPHTRQRSAKRPAPRKLKKVESDDDEVELFQEEDSEMELEEEEEESGEEEPKKKLAGKDITPNTAFLRASEARELLPDKESLSKLVPGVSLDKVRPRQTDEPVFESDPKRHAAFVKKLRLQDEKLTEDGPSMDSPFASITKRAGVKYTPLEQQFFAVKEKHPDVVLFVECGYKYKFFASDALVARNVLGIMAWSDKNTYVASVPVNRLNIHMERLVVAGYKAGVVRQTETAALKQGSSSKNQIFTRELTDIYTTATYLGDAVVCESANPSYLVCVVDAGNDQIAIVGISLRTSALCYDVFQDNFVRSQLETRLAHLQPVEVLVCTAVASAATQALVKSWHSRNPDVRVTPLDAVLSAEEAVKVMSSMYKDNVGLMTLLEEEHGLPTVVVVCLATMGRYLKEFDLDRAMLLADGLEKWSRNEMMLGAETLTNLNVLGKDSSSLLHLCDRTVSSYGSRTLSHWLGHPLMSKDEIIARQDAVQSVRELFVTQGVLCAADLKNKTKDENNQFIALLRLMGSSGDLEQNVAAIYHRRSSPGKFVSTLKSFGALLMLMEKCNDAPSSDLIKSLLARQSEQDNVKLYISSCLADLDHNVACSDPLDWMSLFVGRLDQPVPAARCVKVEGVLCSSLEQTRAGIKEQEALLAQDLKQMRLLLGLPKLEYKSVNGRECLVEIPRSNSKAMASIPDDWEADQHTKACVRYLAPFAKQHLLKLNMYREATVLLAKVRWNIFLEDFARLSGAFKHLVARLAAVDCISSLSLLAMSQGYVRPVISNQRRELHIVQGRHPTAEVNAPNFIGNDTHLDQQAVENMVVTGPNMGGKSTYIRGVALIVILAQVGSFVPAEQCTMGLFDAIFVRMGAEDCLHEGRSTFFSELLSTSSILESATERSLVVIDELGRGTSTFDGTAIAYATLRYLSDLHCLSFFVTHFPLIGSLEATHPNIGNAHVSYLGGQNKDESITFLFQVRPGLETRSYGLNVARMAFGDGFDSILEKAAVRSKEMEKRQKRTRDSEFLKLIKELE